MGESTASAMPAGAETVVGGLAAELPVVDGQSPPLPRGGEWLRP